MDPFEKSWLLGEELLKGIKRRRKLFSLAKHSESLCSARVAFSHGVLH